MAAEQQQQPHPGARAWHGAAAAAGSIGDEAGWAGRCHHHIHRHDQTAGTATIISI